MKFYSAMGNVLPPTELVLLSGVAHTRWQHMRDTAICSGKLWPPSPFLFISGQSHLVCRVCPTIFPRESITHDKRKSLQQLNARVCERCVPDDPNWWTSLDQIWSYDKYHLLQYLFHSVTGVHCFISTWRTFNAVSILSTVLSMKLLRQTWTEFRFETLHNCILFVKTVKW